MSTKDYISPKWQAILNYNGLSDFKSIWKLDARWFETPNLRRGGWSGVNRVTLKTPEGGEINIFLKRQQNHACRTISSPLRGIPTYEREFRNIMSYTKAGVNTLVPIYFAVRKMHNHRCAILITEELTDYVSLDDLIIKWRESQWPSMQKRNELFAEIAKQIRLIHKAGFKHCCLYPKHLLIKLDDNFDNIDVKIIDLEKARYFPIGDSRVRRDLYTIKRRCLLSWTMTDQIRFMLLYLELPRLDKKAKNLCRKMIAHEQKRIKKRTLSQEQQAQALAQVVTQTTNESL